MTTAAPPIPFAGSELGEARHVCAFFNSDDEKYRVLVLSSHRCRNRSDSASLSVVPWPT